MSETYPVQGYIEPLESPTSNEGSNGAVKPCAASLAEQHGKCKCDGAPADIQQKKCPKCDGRMERGKRLISFMEVSVAKEGDYVGEEFTFITA